MHKSPILCLSLFISLAIGGVAHAEHVTLPEMSVTGIAGEMSPYPVNSINTASPDSGELFKTLPGASINRNGPLTSIVQYRGMYSDRVNVMVDGVRLSSAGPNRMDSPLSYLPSSRLQNISIYRGLAPVSSGIETIGGTVKAESKKADFALSDEPEIHGNLNSSYASNGDVRSSGITTSIATSQHRVQISGSLDRSHDQEFDGGTIDGTQAERDTAGISYGFKQNNTEFALDYDHHDTEDTGTPALPMDILWARGNTAKAAIKHSFENGDVLNAKLFYQDADHRMSNNRFRAVPSGSPFRYSDSDVISQGINLSYQMQDWNVGFDADQATYNADIFDPTNASFKVKNFNNAERDRLSVFLEWNPRLNENWKMESGIRISHIEMDADQVSTTAPMAMMQNLARNFNEADRSKTDTLADIVVKFTRRLNSSLDLEMGAAKKQRAPSYQERYLWAPLQSTSGLADGRTYVGDINLDPETAYQLELGLDWHSAKAGVSPRIFYHRVNDYIQGVASSSAPSGALQFANVDAELFGLDANWYVSLTNEWQLDGTVSYVHGERRDTSDNLYRIAPLSASTKLSYVQPQWRVGIEAETVASQNKVSAENDEQKTSGYAIFNLSSEYKINDSFSLSAGVDNLFDRFYRDHLAGYNRVSGNEDIAVGERLPGLGRSLYIGLNVDW